MLCEKHRAYSLHRGHADDIANPAYRQVADKGSGLRFGYLNAEHALYRAADAAFAKDRFRSRICKLYPPGAHEHGGFAGQRENIG